MLLFAIVSKIVGETVVVIAAVLELCFGESSRVVLEFKRALQSIALVSNRDLSCQMQALYGIILDDLRSTDKIYDTNQNEIFEVFDIRRQ